MITIDAGVYRMMIEHMRQAAPNEGCGLLAGPTNPVAPAASRLLTGTCDTWVPMANVAEFPRVRYEMDPAALLEVWTRLEADLRPPCPRDTNGDGDCGRPACPDCGPQGRIVRRRPWIVCHSHVNDKAVPSIRDVRMALDETLLHLVVSLQAAEPVAMLWRCRPFAVGLDSMEKVRYRVVDLEFDRIVTTDLTHGVTDG